MFDFFARVFRQQLNEPAANTPIGWMWKWGLVLFFAGWAWSLITCISLWRQAKADEASGAAAVPPRLAETSNKPPKLS
jgi:hypothetical protein